MKKNFIILTAVLLCYFSSKSQNNIETYYKLINKADSLNYIVKDKSKAREYYFKATDLSKKMKIHISFNEDGLKILRILASFGKNEAIKDLFLYMIKNGLNKNEYIGYKENETLLKPFFQTNYASYIETNFDSLYKLHVATRNLALDFRMVGLLTQDQFSRRVLNMKGIDDYISYDTIAKLKQFIFNSSDCEIRKSIILILKDSIFLRNDNTNYAIGLLKFLLLHNFFNRELYTVDSICNYVEFYNKVEPIIKGFVFIGKFKNTEYAYLIDRANCWGNKEYSEQIYGTHLDKDRKSLLYPIYDIKNVDKRRFEIFLPSLYQASIIEGFQLPKEYIYQK